MKRQPRILAGTAIGLLMASAPLGAFPQSGPLSGATIDSRFAPLILVQEECEGENCPAPGGGQQQEQQAPAQEEQQAPAEEAAPEPEPQPEAAPEPEAQPEPQPEVAPAPEAQPEAAPEPEPQPEPEAAPQQEAPVQEAPAEPAPQAEEPAPEPEAAPAPEQETPAEQAPADEAPAEQPQTQEAPAEQPAPEAPVEEAPAEQAPAEEPQAEEAPAEQAPAEQAPAEETPDASQPTEEAPAGEQPQAEQPATEQQPSPDQPTDGQAEPEAPAAGEQPAQSGEADPNAQPADPNAAPILDSQKEAAPAQPGAEPGQQPAQEGEQPAQADEQQPDQQQGEQAAQPEPADPGPPPESDAAAQAPIQLEEIQPVIAEEGRRIEIGNSREERQRFRQERRERRGDTRIVEEFNDNRAIIEINNHTYIDSPDYDRIIRDHDDVYYEELPRGRVREVVTRENGVRIVTIRNRYGDVVRRSRIGPDDREVILVYVEDRYYQDEGVWRDPGLDLPPMRLTIPREEYILEAEYVDEPEAYYEFLEQPPVERVERTYSLTEVKRSARIRDKVRRIDMDTLTFEFGSASIPESEISKLEGVASAMQKLLEENPGETFLLEGHTDAVGSDLANLALSDKRAESVAQALTNVFDIPPENLATQGYGEQYLKVKTEARERENRRVAIRRVTPLVAPVASAN